MPELYINQTYKNKVEVKLNGFVRECVDQIRELEQEVYNNTVKIELSKDDVISPSRLNTIFRSLNDATDLKTYNLVVDKILTIINRFKTRVEVDDFFEEASKMQYLPIEKEVVKYIEQEINKVVGCSSIQFEYVFPYVYKAKNPLEDNKDDSMMSVEQVELFPDLVKKVEELLPSLKVAAEKFGLVEVQDVNFSCGAYTALKECFFDNEYKKSIKPNLETLLNKIKEMEDMHCLEDVFDDNFLYQVLVVLEASYFVCMFYINLLGDNTSTSKNVKFKNEQALVSNIVENIAYYLDNIAYHTDYDFVSAYPYVTKELNKDKISDLFNIIKKINSKR